MHIHYIQKLIRKRYIFTQHVNEFYGLKLY